MNKPQLIIIRGVPGSGKSTLAKQLTTEMGCWMFEADEFFMNGNDYRFDSKLLGPAHDQCYGSVIKKIHHGATCIVANCFSTDWETERYLKMAHQMDIPVQVIHCKGNFKSVHGVPEEKMEQIRKRFWSNEDLFNKFSEKYPNVSYTDYP